VGCHCQWSEKFFTQDFARVLQHFSRFDAKGASTAIDRELLDAGILRSSSVE